MNNKVLMIFLFCMYFVGCSVTKVPVITGVDKNKGLIQSSYDYGPLQKPQVIWDQALNAASSQCREWGYDSVESGIAPMEECRSQDQYGNCNNKVVKKLFECKFSSETIERKKQQDATEVDKINQKLSRHKINSCEDFIDKWRKNYEYAYSYHSYQCAYATNEDYVLVIYGMPGTKAKDTWLYFPDKESIVRNSDYGKPEYYTIPDFKKIKTAEEKAKEENEKCPNAEKLHNVLSSYALENGYDWSYSTEGMSCLVIVPGEILVQYKKPAGTCVNIKQNPTRYEYTISNRNVLCVTKINGKLVNVGKKCD